MLRADDFFYSFRSDTDEEKHLCIRSMTRHTHFIGPLCKVRQPHDGYLHGYRARYRAHHTRHGRIPVLLQKNADQRNLFGTWTLLIFLLPDSNVEARL